MSWPGHTCTLILVLTCVTMKSLQCKAKVGLQLFNCGCFKVWFTFVHGITCCKPANFCENIIHNEQLKIVQICKVIVCFIDSWATVRWNIVTTDVSVMKMRQMPIHQNNLKQGYLSKFLITTTSSFSNGCVQKESSKFHKCEDFLLIPNNEKVIELASSVPLHTSLYL